MSLTRVALVVALAYSAAVLAMTGRFAEWLALLGADLAVLGSLGAGVGAVLLLGASYRRRRAGQEARPSVLLMEYVRGTDDARCLSALATGIAAVALTLSSYNLFKQFVLPRTGYWLGKTVADTDKAILLGHDAWQVTHALLPHAWQSAVLDMLYHGWFVPMGLGVVLCGFARRGCRVAGRYLTSYVLTWIGQGTVLAWLFPAAGPCFVRDLKHVNRFVPLTDLLAAQDAELARQWGTGLAALRYQSALLHLFRSESVMLGGGIAAMPSLHNALAALFACAAWQLDRRLGMLLTGYAALIWVGSIHLGWHYAVDGVVGVSVAILTWRACGRWQERARRSEAGVPVLVPAVA